MTPYEHGNLARPIPVRPAPAPAHHPEVEAERLRKAKRRETLVNARRAQLVYRQASSARLKTLFASVAVVAVAALSMLIPLWRSAMIVEANYANVRLQNEIADLKRAVTVKDGRLLEASTITTARNKALTVFGMQAADASQKRTLETPKGFDRQVEAIEQGMTHAAATVLRYVDRAR